LLLTSPEWHQSQSSQGLKVITRLGRFRWCPGTPFCSVNAAAFF
jgi:hypothetical protein